MLKTLLNKKSACKMMVKLTPSGLLMLNGDLKVTVLVCLQIKLFLLLTNNVSENTQEVTNLKKYRKV